MAVTDLTDTTWVFNDNIIYGPGGWRFDEYNGNNFNFSINFISDSENFTRISGEDKEDQGEAYIRFYPGAYSYVWTGSNGWIGNAIKTITITGGTDATNTTLISWLEANATQKTVSRKSIDLTTLPGWSALSDGDHTITVVAKADGYTDSEPSAGVTVTKYKQLTAPVIGLSGDILTWSAVPNASSYKLYADNTDKGTVTSGIDLTTLQLAVGTHSIQVMAVGSGYYTDSDKSNSVSYTVQPASGGYTVSITYTNTQNVDGQVTINGGSPITLNQYGTHTVRYSDVRTLELHSFLGMNVISATGSLVGYQDWTTVNITQDSSIAVEFLD